MGVIVAVRSCAAAVAALLLVLSTRLAGAHGGAATIVALAAALLTGAWGMLPFFRRAGATRAANHTLFGVMLALTAWLGATYKAPAWMVISIAALSLLLWNSMIFLSFHRSFSEPRGPSGPLVRRYLAGLAGIVGGGAALAIAAEGVRISLESIRAGIPAPVLLVCAIVAAFAARGVAGLYAGTGLSRHERRGGIDTE